MTRMVSLIPHEYPFGAQRKAGDEFDVPTQTDVNLLVALGRARVKLDVDDFVSASEAQVRADLAEVTPAPRRKSSKRARSAEN